MSSPPVFFTRLHSPFFPSLFRSVVLPVSVAEGMLSTEFGVFEHVKTGKRVVRALNYNIPTELLSPINYVHLQLLAAKRDWARGRREIYQFRDQSRCDPEPNRALLPRQLQSDFERYVDVVDPPASEYFIILGVCFAEQSYRSGWISRSWARPDSLTLYLNDYIPESIGSDDYANAVCQGFAKLGTRGISVLFSSGDQGLGIFDLPTFIVNTGNDASTFLPWFPASCPYVTTVGMTVGLPVQLPSISGGAGLSYYFDRPYLSSVPGVLIPLRSDQIRNDHRRAFPDITAAGTTTIQAANKRDSMLPHDGIQLLVSLGYIDFKKLKSLL
ncbi:hypothetical protein C8J57DRAFT_1679198 [Mycena rebaudengoi]|nr:hypothetical protein C8J57DRAFT_1679198 [Mycena rebaudengoi]